MYMNVPEIGLTKKRNGFAYGNICTRVYMHVCMYICMYIRIHAHECTWDRTQQKENRLRLWKYKTKSLLWLRRSGWDLRAVCMYVYMYILCVYIYIYMHMFILVYVFPNEELVMAATLRLGCESCVHVCVCVCISGRVYSTSKDRDTHKSQSHTPISCKRGSLTCM